MKMQLIVSSKSSQQESDSGSPIQELSDRWALLLDNDDAEITNKSLQFLD